MASSIITSVPVSDAWGSPPLTLRLDPAWIVTAEKFYELVCQNPDVKLEQTPRGEVVVTSPTNPRTGIFNAELIFQLQAWTRKDGSGVAFDSSSLFRMPKGGVRSPDTWWMRLTKWQALSKEDQNTIPTVCPDFVAELRSPSDYLNDLQSKLAEYIDNGAQLGWLIDPLNKTVHVYQPNTTPVILQNPTSVSGEPVLPGFELVLKDIFAA
jgi:Uma2 family endonuclease